MLEMGGLIVRAYKMDENDYHYTATYENLSVIFDSWEIREDGEGQYTAVMYINTRVCSQIEFDTAEEMETFKECILVAETEADDEE